jgi:hypothetical protein
LPGPLGLGIVGLVPWDQGIGPLVRFCLVHRGWLTGLSGWCIWSATVVGVARRGGCPVDRSARASQSGSWAGLFVSLLTGPSGPTLTGLSGSLSFGLLGLRGVRFARLGIGVGLIVCWRARRSVLAVSPVAVFVGKCVRSLATGPSGARICPWAVGWHVTWGGRRLPAALSHPGPECSLVGVCGLLLPVRRVRGFVRGRLGGLSPGVGVGVPGGGLLGGESWRGWRTGPRPPPSDGDRRQGAAPCDDLVEPLRGEKVEMVA